MCMICVSELGCEEYGSGANRMKFVTKDNLLLHIEQVK